MQDLIKSKTFWTGIMAILTAGAGYATGELGGADAIQTGVTGLMGIFLRHSIARG